MSEEGGYTGRTIVILGPTGSGKTGVGIEVAKEIGGEIISADSRTIFKGADLGTAKPSIEEREGVPHFGFDLVFPDERFTVKDWKDYAEKKINEIKRRGNVPIIVGGTGLYIDALIYDYKFKATSRGYGKDRGSCIKNLNGKNGSLKCNDFDEYPDRKEISEEYVLFGIKTASDELRERLKERANKLFVQELYDETRFLAEKYGWDNQVMTGNIYRTVRKLMNGEIDRTEAIELNVIDDWHLAKRQMTWFKRNENILWLPLEKIKPSVIKYIQNEQRK